jgi:hypothetical protein
VLMVRVSWRFEKSLSFENFIGTKIAVSWGRDAQIPGAKSSKFCTVAPNTVHSESRGALRLRYVDLVVSIEVAVEVCCCFTVFSC